MISGLGDHSRSLNTIFCAIVACCVLCSGTAECVLFTLEPEAEQVCPGNAALQFHRGQIWSV